MNKLQEYARRRDFEHTPEPEPKAKATAQGPLRFVVQAHAARTLHYDFRLQVGGVLVSWAVPKGPSLNPRDRRLAMMTEDHPLAYAQFEGIIPHGQYGAGSVIVWDEGTWQPDGDAREGLEKGKLTFSLQGEKLRGRFHLNRTRSRDEREAESGRSAWLLIKGRDEFARDAEESIVQASPNSVLSRRSLSQVERAPQAVWRGTSGEEATGQGVARPRASDLTGARKAPLSARRSPQLATLVASPPEGDTFLHEAKLDGYRLLAEIHDGDIKLWTRGDNEWGDRFPRLVEHLSELKLGEAMLDGEVVALDERGLSNFQRLQNAIGSKHTATDLVYVVFDLVHLDGHDLSKVPLLERKGALAALLSSAGADPRYVRFSEHIIGQGSAFFDEACKLGLEGIVSKRVDAPYRGDRTQSWLKCKCLKRQEVVIGGYTDPSGARSGLGALLVGLHDDAGGLRYAGKVGTGFTEKSLKDLHGRLSKLEQRSSPFMNPPRGAAARVVHWVQPVLLAEVAFSEVTEGGKLRHPSFQGLREDKSAANISLEKPVPLKTVAQPTQSSERAAPLRLPIPLTHPERVLYPEQGVTKQELAEYYVRVADRMLPYVKDRLLTLVRCPGGEGKPCFYQKHPKEGHSDSLLAHALEGEVEKYVYVRDAAGLVALVQLGVLEIHTWGSRINRLKYPDQLVFDLDPDPDLGWERLALGALDMRDELEELGLRSFIKTTGGKGLHLVVPILPRTGWPEVKAFCKALAERMAQKSPSRYVANMAKQKRIGKIFIDYLRNAREATAVAPYSSRARPGAPVATPIAWEELSDDLRHKFSVRSLPERLERSPGDPWAEFFEVKQGITSKAKKKLNQV